jgi:dienelactone hydrolase
MLGWPLDPRLRPTPPPRFRERNVGTDDLGSITRVWIEALPGVEAYGILFRPRSPGRRALVIAQHGGGGAPELVAGFGEDSANYNDMVRRLQRRGFAVFAPQLFRWRPERFGAKHDKNTLDRQLKHLGGSLAALELHLLRRWVDHLGARPEVDPRRIGMMGLSYGGFHALFAAALDPRLAAAVSSCFFNQRLAYDWPDWTWLDSANTFLDAEVATLACPRPLFVEVGRKDPMFDARRAPSEARKVAAAYRQAKAARNFVFRIHPGGHELDRGDAGMDFLCRHLAPGRRISSNAEKHP